jgi:hypothetical protein
MKTYRFDGKEYSELDLWLKTDKFLEHPQYVLGDHEECRVRLLFICRVWALITLLGWLLLLSPLILFRLAFLLPG